jgi:hypothetical protein
MIDQRSGVTLRDSVQIHGWTPATLQRAVETLADLVNAASKPKSEANELAAELVRWLQCAARDDGAQLAEYIDGLRPEGADSCSWDQLESLLAENIPLTELAARLRAHYPDVVQVLCVLLTEKVPEHELCENLDRAYQRAVEVLLSFGTSESLAYVLTRVDFLLGTLSEPMADLVRQHHEALARLALDIWPSLDWHDRSSLTLFYSEQRFPPDALVELLVAVDPETLNHEDRAELVEALVYTEDVRAELALHNIINGALDNVSRHRSEESVEFVRSALHWLIMEMERELPAQQYSRAVALGFDVPYRNVD